METGFRSFSLSPLRFVQMCYGAFGIEKKSVLRGCLSSHWEVFRRDGFCSSPSWA